MSGSPGNDKTSFPSYITQPSTQRPRTQKIAIEDENLGPPKSLCSEFGGVKSVFVSIVRS